MKQYHEVTAQLERALSGISYDKLDISDEVKEQVMFPCSVHSMLFLLKLFHSFEIKNCF